MKQSEEKKYSKCLQKRRNICSYLYLAVQVVHTLVPESGRVKKSDIRL